MSVLLTKPDFSSFSSDLSTFLHFHSSIYLNDQELTLLRGSALYLSLELLLHGLENLPFKMGILLLLSHLNSLILRVGISLVCIKFIYCQLSLYSMVEW